MVDWNSTDTIKTFSDYIYNGMFNSVGSQTTLGIVVLVIAFLFCIWGNFSADASVFIILVLAIFLAVYGFLPGWILYIAALIIAGLLAYTIYQIFRLG